MAKKIITTSKKPGDYKPYTPGNDEVVKKAVTEEKSVNKEIPVPEKLKRKRTGEYQLATKLILEGKYTDKEMVEIVKKENLDRDDKQIAKCISAARYFLNAGKQKIYKPVPGNPIKRLIHDEAGKLVSYSSKCKATSEKDPLGLIKDKKNPPIPVKLDLTKQKVVKVLPEYDPLGLIKDKKIPINVKKVVKK